MKMYQNVFKKTFGKINKNLNLNGSKMKIRQKIVQ